MPAPYPLPVNITGFSQLGQYVNTVTNNVFGIGVLVTLTVIFFTVLQVKNPSETGSNFAVTGVLVAILAILWRFALLITDQVMFTCVALGIGGILYLLFTKD